MYRMRIRYISDIHLECMNLVNFRYLMKMIPKKTEDICILAGDIGNPYQENYHIFMKQISQSFKKSFVIAGNHEYYQTFESVSDVNKYLKSYFNMYDNISFLNNDIEKYEGYTFVGTTLWTNLINSTTPNKKVYHIPKLNHQLYNELHQQSVEFLETSISQNTNNVIITHHFPSYKLIHSKYNTLKMQPNFHWFASNLDDLLRTNNDKIAGWFYGHTHTPMQVSLFNIPFNCNPMGYTNKNINMEKVFELMERN